MMKNDFGQLQAKLNLNIEAEPAAPTPAAPTGAAPVFVEKPKIVTKEEGKLIMLIVKYRAESQCETIWSYKETRVVETKSIKMVHERISDYWESRLELMVSECEPSAPDVLPCNQNNLIFIYVFYFFNFRLSTLCLTLPSPLLSL